MRLFFFMMGLMLPLFLLAAKKPLSADQIGPVFRAPVQAGTNKLFFIGGKGGLYKSDSAMKKVVKLLDTDRLSISGLTRDKNLLFFGEGTHEDTKSNLYVYNTTTNKLILKKEFPGHIESAPLVIGNRLIISLGPKGLVALDKKTFKTLWQVSKVNGKRIHTDVQPTVVGKYIVASSIYENKLLFSLNHQTGDIAWSAPTELSIKSPILKVGGFYAALSTEAKNDSHRMENSNLLILDLKKLKPIIKTKKIRGFNLFGFSVTDDWVQLATSTGDIVKYNAVSDKFLYYNSIREPILASSFNWKGGFCSASSTGDFRCYKNSKEIVKTKFKDNFLGSVSVIDGKVYLPTRAGYRVISD